MTQSNLHTFKHSVSFASESIVSTSIWRSYKFNFNGAPEPLESELNLIRDCFFKTSLQQHIISYSFAPIGSLKMEPDYVVIDEPVVLVALSTTNSAHSISELLSFLNFYLRAGLQEKVAISAIVRDKLKFLYQLLHLFIPADRIILLNDNETYRLRETWVRRNQHFCYLKSWNSIEYERHENTLVFDNLGYTVPFYSEDISIFLSKSAELYQAAKDIFPIYKKVMLAKLSTDPNMTTPGRALIIDGQVMRVLEAGGIKLVSIGDFKEITQYIATLFGAEKFVTSYGGAACTNRFFLNPSSEVVLIGNKQYAWEYEYPSDMGEHWHLRHSHLFPVKKQTVLLYHNDRVTEADAHRLVDLVN
jgi:hypothetical protein